MGQYEGPIKKRRPDVVLKYTKHRVLPLPRKIINTFSCMPIHGFSSYSTLPLAMDFFFLGCLRKVLCPVSRPVTTLGCILLKDNNRAAGPEISSRACLCILQGARHSAICCFSIQSFIFLRISCLETPKKGSGPTNH